MSAVWKCLWTLIDDLPGSNRVELTRATNEKDKDKGLRKQYAEIQHHYVAHVTTVAAVKDVQQLMGGVDLPEDVIGALERVVDLAVRRAPRERARELERRCLRWLLQLRIMFRRHLCPKGVWGSNAGTAASTATTKTTAPCLGRTVLVVDLGVF
ncbi:hypothetical protein CYMTET_7710 [Cymbomonas tetramitiformis]|uniref:Uncharacterized protein n=1 Tax=Cymbomonas tetramitiformis TaxID=36881 RepID=A0AAE0GUQ4_9CHLO|nr:hypothetical protein CYMTET_7710 [Cymbomonas tetramitiformis]